MARKVKYITEEEADAIDKAIDFIETNSDITNESEYYSVITSNLRSAYRKIIKMQVLRESGLKLKPNESR